MNPTNATEDVEAKEDRFLAYLEDQGLGGTYVSPEEAAKHRLEFEKIEADEPYLDYRRSDS